ncbi:MAG: TolC family protein, partial [Sphingobacteriia bacterium]
DFGFIQAQFGTRYNANVGLSLQQLLFDGQVFVGLQARRAAIDFQTRGAEFTEATIKQNVYKIYYQLVASRTQVGLLDANIDRIQKLSNDYKSLYKNGFAEKIDLDKVEVQLTNLQTEKLKVNNAIEMGYLGLKTLMGMPIRDTLILTEELTYEKINDFTAIADGFQYTDRKDFQYLSLARDLNAYNVKRYKLTYLPTLALGANYGKIAQRNQFNFLGKGDWFTVSSIGLNMSVPLFTGFARDARVKKAEIDLKQTDDQIADLKRQIDNSIEQAAMKYRTAVATLTIQKKNMELAERVFNQTKKKYEVGTGSNTEIYAADVDLKAAQTNYLNALYDAIVARVDFLFATGKL